MPLCQLQKALKKGEVLEVRPLSPSLLLILFVAQGILRINPKNYEDAYISAPVIIGDHLFLVLESLFRFSASAVVLFH